MKILRFFREMPDKIGQHYLKKRIGKNWVSQGDPRFKQRKYGNYQDYIEHQAAKLKFESICPVDLQDYDKKYRQVLRDRIKNLNLIKEGQSVLCLGARLGTEVKAFLDHGCFAVGIDLNPGKSNYYVLRGDFHNLQFADRSVDVVFSNSVDHVFDLGKFAKEVVRVLKAGGLLVIEVARGREEGGSSGFYESLHWSTIDELISFLKNQGFDCLLRQPIDFPLGGEHLILQVSRKDHQPPTEAEA
jgi:SAM-dependent methyltransferase